jgi:hypothetical protein
MEIPLLEMEGTGAEIAERLSDYADQRVHVIVLPARPDSEKAKNARPIAEALAEIAASVPAVEAAKLPADFTDQLDHYIYGSPKR